MSGTFKFHADENNEGQRMDIELKDYAINTLHSLENFDIHDDLSSLSWDVESDIIVTLYENKDGTGRTYTFGRGIGSDNSTHGADNFKDCISSWRWTKVGARVSVIEAFERIATQGKKITFPGGTINLPGGHFQGVARLNNQILAISTSSEHIAHVYLYEWKLGIGYGAAELITQINVGRSPYGHAGGIQIADHILAVGVEDFDKKDKSLIKFYDLSNPRIPVELDHLTVKRSSGTKKIKTAGAVGLLKLTNKYLLIVGSWGSATIDFYYSSKQSLTHADCKFSRFATWKKETIDNSALWIDDNWGSYQSLNLVSFNETEIFIIGGQANSFGLGKDWIDLYEVQLLSTKVRLIKKQKRNLKCEDGTGFINAGGILIDGFNLHAIATERDPQPNTAANLFEGSGGIHEINPTSAIYLQNYRSKEIHSLEHPCRWVKRIAKHNIQLVYQLKNHSSQKWCTYCFPNIAGE